MILKPEKLLTLLLVRVFFDKIIDEMEGYFLFITSSRLETLEYLDKAYISFGENVALTLTRDCKDHLRKIMRGQDFLYNQNQGKFAIFLPKTSSKASESIAENILKYLDAEIFSIDNTRFTLTASTGIAKDLQAAIKFLQQKAPTDKPTIKLTNGKTVTGIVSVDVMSGGTLLIFKIAS